MTFIKSTLTIISRQVWTNNSPVSASRLFSSAAFKHALSLPASFWHVFVLRSIGCDISWRVLVILGLRTPVFACVSREPECYLFSSLLHSTFNLQFTASEIWRDRVLLRGLALIWGSRCATQENHQESWRSGILQADLDFEAFAFNGQHAATINWSFACIPWSEHQSFVWWSE